MSNNSNINVTASASSFRGFADFAKHTDFATSSGSTTAAALLAARRRQAVVSSTTASTTTTETERTGHVDDNQHQQPQFRPSPIYTGNDARLSLLFRKISQKRNPTTKIRALEELIGEVYPCNSTASTVAVAGATEGRGTTSPSPSSTSSSFSRPDKIAALSHLIYLHETKLGYDNNPSVRALSYMTLVSARSHVPKAWSALFLGIHNGENAAAAAAVATSSIGMAWGAMRGDPATEVSRNAGSFMNELIRAEREMEDEEKNKGEEQVDNTGQGKNCEPVIQHPTTLVPGRKIQLAIFQYSKMVLDCKRPSSLQEFIINSNTALSSASAMTFSSVGSPTLAASSDGGKKSKKGKNSSGADFIDSTTTTATSADLEKEEMAERYERVILSVLFGLGWLFECCSGQSSSKEGEEVNDKNIKKDLCCHASAVLFPDASPSILRLLASSRGSFRRGTYILLGQICQYAPSLLTTSTSSSQLSYSLSMGSLIPSLLSSEKDPSNFVPLLEMILSYLAAAQGGKLGGNVGAFRVGDDRTGKGDNGTTSLVDPVTFTSALSKALRRGCYGAPAVNWGPIILPFVATLPAYHHGDGYSGEEELKGRNEEEHQQGPQIQPPRLPFQLAIVSSLWEGRKYAPGVTDTIAIVSAVAECATYLLLRRSQRSLNFTAQSWRLCGQLFLNAMSYYLTEAPDKSDAFGPVASAVDGLCKTLSRDLKKLDVSLLETDDDNKCDGILSVESWLWGQDGIEQILLPKEVCSPHELSYIYRKWDSLLKSLQSLYDVNQSSESRLVPTCKKLFHTIVNNHRLCDDDEGKVLLSILQFGHVDNIFSRNTASCGEIGDVDLDEILPLASIERFCVNDLLGWMLKHASTSSSTINTDLEIFQLCMHSIPSLVHQKLIWETILRELIKSCCDYTSLAIGLETLARGEASKSFVSCQVLDIFAIDTAQSLVNEFQRSHDILHYYDEIDSETQSSTRGGDVSRFLKSCVGISNDCSGSGSIIVSESVIQRWIDLCCERYDDDAPRLENNLLLEDESGKNVLLKNMLELSSRNSAVVSQAETIKLVCQSWFEGGSNWHGCAAKRLIVDEVLKDHVILIAEKSLSDDIRSTPSNDDKLLDLVCHSWAKRAARLIGVHPAGSLFLIGIGDAAIWEYAASTTGNYAEYLFLCLMYLLDSLESDELRRNTVLTNADLFVYIQVAITRCNAESESFHQRTDRSRQLVDILGGRDMLSRSFLEHCCIQTTEILAKYMKSGFASRKVLMMRGLTTLSFIVSLLFPSAFESRVSESNSNSCVVDPLKVREGDTVWYERGDHGMRAKATVVKVHTDDFPRLYFTIKEESAEGERQTVASRLRWTNEEVIESTSPDKISSAQRERIGRFVVDKLVTPFLSEPRYDDDDDDDNDGDSRTIREFSAESINVVISQCGLVSLGVGSVKYDIFQVANSMIKDLCTALPPVGHEPILEKAMIVLRYLSLAMGYGFYTIPARNNLTHLNLDAKESILQLLQLYENEQWLDAQRKDPLIAFHSSALMWFTVAVSANMEGELLGRIARAIFSCSALIFFDGLCDLVTDSIHVMKAIRSLHFAMDRCSDCSATDNEHETYVLSKLTQTFIDLGPHNRQWIESFASLLQQECSRSRGTAFRMATTYSNELCGCLFDPMKRWCAFQLLSIFARNSHPLKADDGTATPPDIDRHLSEWKKELSEEEAIELEEDVSIASLWLQEYIMSLFLHVGTNPSSMKADDDAQIASIGNLLAWIISLDIVEVAGTIDMRNRVHISSFIQKSNALSFIMNLALQEADLNVSRGENIFDCTSLHREDMFLPPKLATLALFRTVESLPSMVKTWYNDDCPRFLQHQLSVFVENVVAPTTLQRELTRIKDDSLLSDMTVTGSCVSREVVATYQQDECHLSVLIRMPPTFPLRNVEVDCKKTMGIPEKRWRRWALQIMLMLNNQDGSILDALLLWKQNVDKEFDGVEPCPVCYSVLCIKTHQMPNLECKTCHNRFHTTCLMKWFQSSGKSLCVLCQQPWSGAKI